MQITSEHSKIKWNSADTRQGSINQKQTIVYPHTQKAPAFKAGDEWFLY